MKKIIVSKFVKTFWSPSNKKHYESLGYKYTKMGNKLKVKIKDLLPCSKVKIKVKCPECLQIRQMLYSNYYKKKSTVCFVCKKKKSRKKKGEEDKKERSIYHDNPNRLMKQLSVPWYLAPQNNPIFKLTGVSLVFYKKVKMRKLGFLVLILVLFLLFTGCATNQYDAELRKEVLLNEYNFIDNNDALTIEYAVAMHRLLLLGQNEDDGKLTEDEIADLVDEYRDYLYELRGTE